MKKKIITILTLCLSLIMVLPLFACGPAQEGPSKAETFVSLDINPAIELTLDDKNNVVSIRGTNEDGQVLLYGQTNLTGKNVEEVVDKITDLAIELGYITEDNKVVSTSVSAKTEEKAQAVLNKVNAKITASAGEADISISIDGEGAYSLLRKYEQYKEEHPDDPIVQNLTADQFKLALSASETGEISLDVAVTLNNEKLIEIISEKHTALENYATEAFNKAKAQANKQYETAKGILLDSVYVKYSLIDGTVYNAYKNTARLLNGVADVLVYTQKIGEYEVSPAQAQEVLVVLGLEQDQIDLIENSDGKVTLESIYDYVDVLLKNADEQTANEIKGQLDQTLLAIEVDVKGKIEQAAQAFVDEIENSLSAIDLSSMPAINQSIATYKELVDDLKEALEDGITPYELREIADKMNKKADLLAKDIEANLTEEKLEQLNQDKAQLENGLDSAYQAYEQAVNQSMAQAKARLEELRQERTNK